MEVQTVPVFEQWPAGDGPVERAELLRIAEARLAHQKWGHAEETRDYQARLDKWRQEVPQRLLALIPALESADSLAFTASRFSTGGWEYQFRAPQPPYQIDTSRHDSLIAALHELPDGPIPLALWTRLVNYW